MNKLLDVFIVIGVFIFGGLLVMTVMKTCAKPNPKISKPELESTVIMGDKEKMDDSSLAMKETKAWDEDIDRNDTSKMEADGFNPEEMEALDPELASKITEQGDEGIKKEKKEKSELTNPEPESSPKLNVSPGDEMFFVIAGSFKDPTNAENLVKKLKGYGYPAEAVQFLNNKLKSVSVSRFASKQDAGKLVTELKSKHKIEAYVLKKRDK